MAAASPCTLVSCGGQKISALWAVSSPAFIGTTFPNEIKSFLEVLNFAYVNFCASTISPTFAVVYFWGVYPIFAVNTFSRVKSKARKLPKIFISS